MAYHRTNSAHSSVGGALFILVCLAFLFVSCSFTPARAESYVYVGGFSHHFTSGDYNETHDYFGLRIDGYTVGTFNNSYNQRTFILSKYFKALEFHDFELGAQLGATYGYTKCYGHVPGGSAKVCGLLLPELTYTRYKWEPSFGFTHKVITLTFRRPL